VQRSRRLADSRLPPGGSSRESRIGFITHASPDGTFKAARRLLGIFPKTRKQYDFDYAGHHIHTLRYKNNHRVFIHIKELP